MRDLINFNSIGNAGVMKLEISANDLLKAVEEVVRETAEAVIKNLQRNESPELITRKEAKVLLDVKTAATMIKWEKKGYLQPRRIGGRIFYRKDEVIEAAESFVRVEED